MRTVRGDFNCIGPGGRDDLTAEPADVTSGERVLVLDSDGELTCEGLVTRSHHRYLIIQLDRPTMRHWRLATW